MGDFKVPTKPAGSGKGKDMAQGQTGDTLVAKVKAYDFGQSRAALTRSAMQSARHTASRKS